MNTSEDENINSYGQFSKPWDELEITDNYLFCKIMSQPDFCKEMIERILERIKSLSIWKPVIKSRMNGSVTF